MQIQLYIATSYVHDEFVTPEIKATASDGKPFVTFSSVGNTFNTEAAIICQLRKYSMNSEN